MSIPRTDPELVNWSNNADERLTASPELYGTTPIIAQQYNVLHTAFILAYNELTAARQSGVRSSPLAAAKDQRKRDLLTFGRGVYKTIQANAAVLNSDKILLGIQIIADHRAPVPAPDSAPGISIVSVDGRCVRARIYDPAHPDRKRMPDKVSNATILSFVGPTPPARITDYKFEGGTTRCNVDILFPDSVAPGTQVWLAGFFSNGRDQNGPACNPVGAIINYGGSMRVAA